MWRAPHSFARGIGMTVFSPPVELSHSFESENARRAGKRGRGLHQRRASGLGIENTDRDGSVCAALVAQSTTGVSGAATGDPATEGGTSGDRANECGARHIHLLIQT